MVELDSTNGTCWSVGPLDLVWQIGLSKKISTGTKNWYSIILNIENETPTERESCKHFWLNCNLVKVQSCKMWKCLHTTQLSKSFKRNIFRPTKVCKFIPWTELIKTKQEQEQLLNNQARFKTKLYISCANLPFLSLDKIAYFPYFFSPNFPIFTPRLYLSYCFAAWLRSWSKFWQIQEITFKCIWGKACYGSPSYTSGVYAINASNIQRGPTHCCICDYHSNGIINLLIYTVVSLAFCYSTSNSVKSLAANS